MKYTLKWAAAIALAAATGLASAQEIRIAHV